MKRSIVTTEIRTEQDVVFARQRAREIARLLGYDHQDQIRIATAVSELARNAFQYARGGRAEFGVEGGEIPRLVIVVRDSGPGIPNLEEILGGLYQSPTGMGVGLIGAKRLMDGFSIDTTPGRGTSVTIQKKIPVLARADLNEQILATAQRLSAPVSADPYVELQQQNKELVEALDALSRRQEELNQLNQELEDTNRGVVALYAELDQKAQELRQANSVKTRFLSNITHEFRTPLNGIHNMTRLLLDHSDGPLTEGQEHQIRLIRKSVEGLSEMVNDLLDIAKVEAGKVPVRVTEFVIPDLFASLRALFKPQASHNPAVALHFEDGEKLPSLRTDEGKVTQILRNFISNALKYTEHGSVTVNARLSDARDHVVLSVADTGIGIKLEDQDKIFEEFVQIESPQQAKQKGTGLGLSLTRKLVMLLCGRMWVESEPGRGSVFHVELPLQYTGPEDGEYISRQEPAHASPKRAATVTSTTPSQLQPEASEVSSMKVLLIDDSEQERYLLRSILVSQLDCQVEEADGGIEGIRRAQELRPALIFLDLSMPDMSGFDVIERLRSKAETAQTPVIIYSGKFLTAEEQDRLNGAMAFLSKSELGEEQLITRVLGAAEAAGIQRKSR